MAAVKDSVVGVSPSKTEKIPKLDNKLYKF